MYLRIFQETSINSYKSDPCHYFGIPAFGWDDIILKTYVILHLLTDNDRYQFFKRGIRGGQSVIFKKYAKANIKHLRDCRSNEISTYFDANNLFGVSMSCKLPHRECLNG